MLTINPSSTGFHWPNSSWNSLAENVLIGGQVGGKWYCRKGRWTFASEGRFLAAANFQNLNLNGVFGSEIQQGDSPFEEAVDIIYPGVYPRAFESRRHEIEFSPVAEVRIDVRYQFTKAVSFKLGWTGLYVGNVARGSNMINYTAPNYGIAGNNREKIFAHGVNFGVELNR